MVSLAESSPGTQEHDLAGRTLEEEAASSRLVASIREVASKSEEYAKY
jgi:hypothetical protein